MKKVLLLILPILLCGCSADEPDKTYNALKEFDKNEYHLVYKDVTENKNSPYEITVAVSDNKYYYSDGRTTIIQKDNKKYTLNDELLTYNVEETLEYEDFTYGMFDIPKDNLKDYEKGKTSLYGKQFVFEEFGYNNNNIKYYYKNNELEYVKSKGAINKTIEVIKLDKNIENLWFELPEDYSVITY